MIRAAAPGKLVLWGEYAVLEGAPALVMAVDRYAVCELAAAGQDDWHCTAAGFSAADARVPASRLRQPSPPSQDQVWFMLWHVLRAFDLSALPDGAEVRLDTAGFHHRGAKLGLGSSAALCVAVYGALCRLLQQPCEESAAHTVHRSLQGGAGSGIDVAAAWHGGLLRYQIGAPERARQTSRWRLPADVHTGFVWTGIAARTSDHLERLRCWRDGGGHRELQALRAAAAALFETADLLEALADYVATLQALDEAAALGVFSDAHTHLGRLAIDAGVIYKPCGAGGGDVGAAFAADPGAVKHFQDRAARDGFLPLALETAPHGIEVTG